MERYDLNIAILPRPCGAQTERAPGRIVLGSRPHDSNRSRRSPGPRRMPQIGHDAAYFAPSISFFASDPCRL